MNPRMLTYYLYRFAGFLAPLIPIRLGHWLMDRVADLAARSRPWERAIVGANIRQVLGHDPGEAELDRMVRDTYRHSMKNYFDLFWMAAHPTEQVLARVETEGWEHLKGAFEMGRGAIVVSMHYGNPELALQLVPLAGKPCLAPAEHVKPEALYQYLCRLRTTRGLRLIPVDGPLTELLRTIRRGEAIGLALDRDATDSGRVVEFFGKPAHLPDGAAQMALRTGAPVVVIFSQRLPGSRYVLRALPPVILDAERHPDDEAVEEAMRRILEVAEHEMRKDPSQWVVFRPIWNN